MHDRSGLVCSEVWIFWSEILIGRIRGLDFGPGLCRKLYKMLKNLDQKFFIFDPVRNSERISKMLNPGCSGH